MSLSAEHLDRADIQMTLNQLRSDTLSRRSYFPAGLKLEIQSKSKICYCSDDNGDIFRLTDSD